MSKVKTVAITDILSEQEIKDVTDILQNASEEDIIEQLKAYLNNPERAKELEHKGVLPDYLAYCLYAQAKNIS